MAGETASAIAKNFTSLRTELTKALQAAAVLTSARTEIDELPELANLPIIDASPIDSDLELKKPLGSFLGKGFLRRHLVSELKTQYGSILEECLAPS